MLIQNPLTSIRDNEILRRELSIYIKDQMLFAKSSACSYLYDGCSLHISHLYEGGEAERAKSVLKLWGREAVGL